MVDNHFPLESPLARPRERGGGEGRASSILRTLDNPPKPQLFGNGARAVCLLFGYGPIGAPTRENYMRPPLAGAESHASVTGSVNKTTAPSTLVTVRGKHR